MQQHSEQPAIRVSDLVVGFRQQTVIDHLSLDVRRGEILGLVGASGGGKSVLMRTSISTAITTAIFTLRRCGASCSSRARCSRR
jgi:ABC-type transporter Mla maintaining outer membrane lipid asymmetry ATPase subunit MlaF